MSVLENLLNDEYSRFFIILIGTIIFVTLSYFILKLIAKRIAGKKKSYDVFIRKKLSKPVLFIVFFIGTYTALKSLSILNEYYAWIDGGFFVIIISALILFVDIVTSNENSWNL